MSTSHAPTPDVEVVIMTTAEWRDAIQSALAKLGLTFDELAAQAKQRDFSSLEARKLWVAIGGKKP